MSKEETQELYPGHAEALQRHRERAAAIGQANTEPLPGPLVNAFAREQISKAGITLRPWVASDIVLLRRLDSPILRQLQELKKPPEERKHTDYSDEEGAEMIYQFTVPPATARALLNKGRDAYQEASMELLDRVPAGLVNELVLLCVENMFQAFQTVVPHGPPERGGEGGTFFTPPPPAGTTGSDGGCNTAPGCSNISRSSAAAT